MYIDSKLLEARRKLVKSRGRPYRKPLIWLFPTAIEYEYVKRITKLLEQYFKDIEKLLDIYLPQIIAENESASVKQDSFADFIQALVDKIKERFQVYSGAVKGIVSSAARSIDVWNKRQFIKIIASATKLNIVNNEIWKKEIAEAFIKRNVSLITNLSDELAHKIENVVYNGVSTSKRVQSIKKEIMGTDIDQGVFPSTKKRAILIARDQVGKFNGQMTMNRQKSIGILFYIWRTSVDERVRDSHKEREGKRYSWDNPPEDGHPGFPIQCRCYAEPVFDEFLEALK